MVLHLKLHLSRLYDGVPEGLLHLLRLGRFDGCVVPEKSSLGDTVEAPHIGPMRKRGAFLDLLSAHICSYRIPERISLTPHIYLYCSPQFPTQVAGSSSPVPDDQYSIEVRWLQLTRFP